MPEDSGSMYRMTYRYSFALVLEKLWKSGSTTTSTYSPASTPHALVYCQFHIKDVVIVILLENSHTPLSISSVKLAKK